jgi:thioredoxin 1
MKSVTTENFTQEIDAPCLAYFWAAWCGPCFNQEEELKILEKEFPKIGFLKINCDENHQLANDHNIIAVPTTILFKNGKVVQRLAGMQKVSAMREALKKL